MYILSGLAHPSTWPTVAQVIKDAMAGNGTYILNTVNVKESVDLEHTAVTCNDAKPFPPPKAEDVVDEWLFVTQNLTRFTFATAISSPDNGCQFWPVTPPERYAGPWDKTPKNPILIIANTVRLVQGAGVG